MPKEPKFHKNINLCVLSLFCLEECLANRKCKLHTFWEKQINLSLGLLLVNFKSFMEIVGKCLSHSPTFWYQVFPIVITFIDDSGASLAISLTVIWSILRAELPQSVPGKCVSKWTSFRLPDTLFFFCYIPGWKWLVVKRWYQVEPSGSVIFWTQSSCVWKTHSSKSLVVISAKRKLEREKFSP